MKFFIDTANIEQIKDANNMGMVDGVTTNPSLIAKEEGEFKEIIAEICGIVDGPVSAEVISLEYDGMVKEARELARIAKNICVKIPMTVEGLKAVKTLSSEGIKTNVTLVFSALQALMAAKAGATYVSPFVGRLDDLAQEGMGLIEQIGQIFANYDFDTEIIVASVRNSLHVLDSALVGADIATIPYGVLKKLAAHHLTDKGIEAFYGGLEEEKRLMPPIVEKVKEVVMTPNAITISRVLAVPVIVLLLTGAGKGATFTAALLFSIASATDYLDGYLARTRGLESTLGKILDPLADKLLVSSTLIMLTGLGFIPGWIACIIIGREIAVTGLRCVLIEKKQDVAASWLGKYKTGFQIAAIIPLTLHYPYFGVGFQSIGMFFLYGAMIFTLWSGFDYFYKARKFIF